MNRVSCSACNRDVSANPPNHGYWALIVAFWVFSLLFGLGAAMGSGWGFMLLVAWLLLATTTGVLVQRATAWTCAECGAAVGVPEPTRPARARRAVHAHT